MTTIDRATVEQALEALENGKRVRACEGGTKFQIPLEDNAITALRAALAQQAEPVEPVARVVEHGATVRLEWVSADAAHNAKVGPLFSMPPQRKPLTEEEIRDLWSWSMTAEAERTATTQQHAFTRAVERAHGITDPQVADRLARHNIPMPEAPACPDCHGIGYDASGQTCACQENPSF